MIVLFFVSATTEFQKEVLDSLMNGVRENTDAGKVALEINSSRYAYNIVLEVMQAIVFEVRSMLINLIIPT